MQALKQIFKQDLKWDDWDNSDVGSSVITLREFPKEFRTRKLIKYSSKRKAFKTIFQEYCDNSSIHGVRYLSEEKRPIWEKVTWIFILSLSIYFCIALIHNTWIKWAQNPVIIVSFNEKSTPVWNIPFPALTICPEAKTEQEIFNFTNVYSTLYRNRFKNGTANLDENLITKNETNYLRALLQVCDIDFIKNLQFPKDLDPIDVFETLEEFTPEFNITYPYCKYNNKVYPSCDRLIFFKVFTADGICYTYNGLPESHIYKENTSQYNKFVENYGTDYNVTWNLEDGYNNSADIEIEDAYPTRVYSAHFNGGFYIILQAFEQNLDHMCKGAVKGFRILLHSPDDVPYITKNFIRVPLDREILIRIIPNIIQTTETFKHILPSKRQCYFAKERSLKFFKIYSQANCELECLANITLKKCGCVKFSMPREPATRVCDVNEILCQNEAEDDLLQLEFAEGHLTSKENYRGETTCNCLPGCTSLTYDAEISQAVADFEGSIAAFNESEYFEENPGLKMTKISIFFKELQYITSRRSEWYGLPDFLANCGGLLSLFMGVSVVSLIELIYHCTVRLTMNLKMRSDSQKVIEDLREENIKTEFQTQYNDLFNKSNLFEIL